MKLHYTALFWLGFLGILFYIFSPLIFPDVPNLRQPELLPIYTLMLGLNQLLRSGHKYNEVDEENEDSVSQSKKTDEV